MAFDDHFRAPDLTGMEPVPPKSETTLTRPAMPPNDPGPNPFLRTTLPPSFGLQPDSLRHFYNPMVPQQRLVPLQRAANPAYAAIAKSVVLTSKPAEPPSADPFLHFRGTWQSFTPYAINDVVLFNQSAYVAVVASTNVEPDTSPGVRQNIWSTEFLAAPGFITKAFTSNLLAGSTIVVTVLSGNYNSGNTISISDTQGNTYVAVATDSFTDSGGGIYTGTTYTANAKSGSCSITAVIAGSNGAGAFSFIASEMTNLSSVDNATSVGQQVFSLTGQPFPSLTVNCSAATDLVYTACLDGGITGSGFGVAPIPPGGFASFLNSTGNNAYDIAWEFTPQVGTNTIQWGGAFAYGSRFLATAVSFKTVTGVWVLLSENFSFGVPPTSSQFNPFEVVQFRGSMFVCLKPTNSDAFSDPSSWALLAQGTGSIDILSGNYTPVAADYARLIQNNTASTFTVTLPAPPSNSWWIALQNSGTGTIVLSPGSLTLDGSSASITLHQNQGLLVFTDGTNFETLRGMGTVTNITGALTNHAVVLGNGGADIKAAGSLGTATTVLHGNASGDPSFGSVVENDLSLSNVTTANVSTSQHGFAPILPNDSTKFLNGVGAYTVPAGGGGGGGGGVNAETANYTAVSGDNGKLISFTAAGNLTLTLPASPPSSTWWVDVEEVGTGSLTINPNGLQLDGTTANLVLPPGTVTTGDAFVLGGPDPINLPNSVANPTAYYGVNVQPATAGTLDDEFGGSVLSGSWAWNNQGTATASLSKSKLTITDSLQGSGSQIIRYIYQSAPATPWEVTAGPFFWYGTYSNFAGAGIAVSDGTKLIPFILQQSSGESVGITYFTNATTYSGSLLTFQAFPWEDARYLRIKDDGTNRIYSLSPDGVTFWKIAQESRTNFLTASQVGIFAYPNASTNAGSTSAFIQASFYMTCDWFRRTV